jgi:hypothetical protein
LKLEMTMLLALPQANMDATGLAAHHQQITTNFNNQVAAKLGPVITIAGLKLAVPQNNSKPVISAPQLLARNPALRHELNLNKTFVHDYAKHVTNASMGYLAALNKWQEIRDHNHDAFIAAGIDIDNLIVTPQMLKGLDRAVKSSLDNNQGLLEHLLENNKRAIAAPFIPNVNPAIRPEMSGIHLPKLSIFARRAVKRLEDDTPEVKNGGRTRRVL